MPVTPLPGAAAVVTVGGTPVAAVPADVDGTNCIITNPLLAVDQGIVTAEPIYVNPVDAAGLEAHGNNWAIEPGASWTGIAGQVSATSVNANTSGHRFSVVYWKV